MSDPRLARPSWRGRTNVDALTIAVIERAEDIVRRRQPTIAHELVITQGSYQAGAGDPDSGTTHDKGGVADAAWCGHPFCVRALREAGAAAWHRTPRQGPWKDHIHFVVVGHPLLAASAAAQVEAYEIGRNGLLNNGPDDGPRIIPIPRPVWPWPPQEEDVTPEDIQKVAQATVKLLMQTDVADKGPNVRAALRQAAKGPQLIRGLDDAFAERVVELCQQRQGSDPSPETIKAAVKQALREGTAEDDEQ